MSTGIAVLIFGTLSSGILISSASGHAGSTPSKTADTKRQNACIQDMEELPYGDGNYRGTSQGWTGMKVDVQIRKGKIHAIRVVEVRGTPRIYQAVVDSLPRTICLKNGIEVDGISGATLSSNSLKQAVQNALQGALQHAAEKAK